MAERKNFLDREKEKRDGENYLPYSIALIPGLTALEQDALVKDIAEGLVKRNVEARQFDPYEPESIYAAIERRKAADKIEEYVQRLPEPLRDSYLISSIEGTPPYFYGEATRLNRGIQGSTGFYDPEKNRVFIDMDHFLNSPSVIIHENAHKTNHDLNLSHPYYDKVPWELVPERMVGAGLGRKLSNEMPSEYKTPKGVMDKGELVDELSRIIESGVNGSREAIGFYGNTLENMGLTNVNDGRRTPEMSRKQWRDRLEFVSKRQNLLDDFVNLDPNFEGREYQNLLKDEVTLGHPRAYRKGLSNYADKVEFALNEAGKGERDFLEHFDTVPYAALSAESAAELAELMATEGGEEYVKSKFPKTYEFMMNEYRNDPRRSLPKRRLRPWELYSHESPSNVYGQRGEPVAYDKNAERHYLRVPDPYGGWHYADDYLDSRHQAVKRGKNYIEYRDLDNKWKRFYPSELKSIKENNIYGTKRLAKELGKKLLKGVK